MQNGKSNISCSRKFYFTLIGLFLFPLFTDAKKLNTLNHTPHKEFYFNWDNDVFLSTDFYYSQGFNFYYINPALRKNPINHLFLKLNNADNYFGLGVIQEIYTPKDLIDTLLNRIDRPFAGTLFLRSFVVSSNPHKKLGLRSQLDLGVLGPLSGAKQAQQIIHDWTGSTPPQGWDFQIHNRPYINYNLQVEKGLIQIPNILQFMGLSEIRVGNIHDDVKLGANIRVGRINDYFKGLNLGNKKYIEHKDLQFFLLGGINFSGVLYNATLMGGIRPPESNHQFEFREIEHLITEFNGGVQIAFKSISFKGMVTWKTPEFENGESHGWGTLSMFIRL